MKYSNTVEYNIKTSLDSKGLTQLKSELQGLELKLQNMGNKGLLEEKTFVDARNQIQGLGQALSDAFNPSLGMLDLSKLNQELKNNDVTAQGLKTAFSSLGAEGQVAFNNLVGELGKLDTGILRTNSQIDKLFTTFSNTFRWGLVSSFFSQFMNAIHSSVGYVKELDDSLTQIMLVTDYNKDSMNEFARSANEAAKAVSMTTTGMTNASLIFAQQGYDLGQSQELATLSAKLANASQQDTATTSDQITAYMNAYGLENSIGELTQAMDNWALIANISAADVGELAQASQRAASMANTVGVSGEQLAAQIATIESVTREAPEQIGNGLKTLYARFSDISAGGEDEDGVSLGDVTKQLNDIGVQVLDQFGNIRDVGDIMEDLMVVWDDLDETSKIAAAQSLAGKYQVNRFVSLMDNSDMYREYLGATGSSAAGTLDQMNEEYAQSIEGRTAKLQASLEGLFSTVFNTDDIYPWIDAAQGAVDLLQQFFDALGGGKTVLLGISSLLMQIFSQNMAREINNAATNRAVQQQKLENLQNSQAALTTLGVVNSDPNNTNSQNILNFAQYMQAHASDFNVEQMNQANSVLDELIQNGNAATQASEELKKALEQVGTGITSALGENGFEDFVDEFGAINQTLLTDFLKKNPTQQISELFSDMVKKTQPAKEAVINFNKELQNHQQILDKYGFESEEAAASAEKLTTALAQLNNKVNGETIERYSLALDDIKADAEHAAEGTAKLTGETARLIGNIEEFEKKDIGKIREGLDAASFKYQNAEMAAGDSNKVAGAFKKGIADQSSTQDILNTINAVQQLTFAWQTFQNLGSIWKNNKLSDGEKFLQTFMSLTSAIMMMSPAVDLLSKKFGVLNLQEAASLLTSAKVAIAYYAQTIAFGASSVAAGDLTIQQWLLVASEEAATIATLGLNTALKLLASPVGIAAIMGIAAAIGFVQAQAEEAKQQALDNLEDAKSALQEIEALKDKIGTFKEGYDAYKENGEGGSELIQQANEIAQAMKEAGAEEEANAIHLAALRAETRGAADDFSALANAVEKSQDSMSENANNEAIAAAEKLLKTENISAEDVLRHQSMLKEAQEELNNLDPLDAGYEDEKERLEHLIDTLQNAKLAQEDFVNAANEYQQAQGRLAGITTAENQGLNLYAGGQQGQRMNPDSAIWFENANLDYNSIERIYSNMVEGFSDLSNLEKAQFILETIGDEAGKAAAQLELLMQSFNNLDANQIDHLQNQMAQGGLTFSQQQLLTTSLDPDTTAAEFSQTVQDVLDDMDENHTTFEVALKAKLKNPEEFQEAIRQQVESYEPKDDEIEQEDYNSMTEHFYENKDKMGEEGSGFENYSEDLFNNAEALSEVIEDTLRYSDAIEEISDNFDNWIDTLNKGEKTSKEYSDAVDGLKDTFSDFLGIPEELSEEFVTTEENLNDLQAAAEGDVDAFDRLQTAAAIDLAEQLGVDSDTAITAVNNIQSALDELGYSEVDIGEVITFSDDALNTINTQLDNLCLDADQAAAYLESAFGIKVSPGQFEYVQNDIKNTEQMAADSGSQMANDMTVTPEITTASAEQVATDEKNYTDVDPNITYEPWTATLPVTGGGLGAITTASTPTPVPISGEVPVITYNAKSKTAKETKTDTALATGVKAEQGGSGVPKNSHVNLKSGSSGTRTGGRAPSSSAPRPFSSGGGGGGGKKSCFVAGTLVSIWGGFKPIEQIKKGNIVLSYNKRLGINEYSEVIQTMIHDTIEPIYTLYIKDEQLRVTGIHRFLVTDKITCGVPQWVHAADLHVGQWVLFADGTWHVIHKIEVNIEHQTVYNFEVSGNHNYYVGRNQILAHNKGGGKKGKGGGGGKAKTIEPKEKKEHEKDYYEEVSKQLDKTEKVLSGIEKKQDKLTGDKARANQNKQINLLQKEIVLQKEKLEILTNQEKVDVAKKLKETDKEAEKLLKKNKVLSIIPNPIYDEDGMIANYEQMSKAIDDAHNKLIDKYNAAAAAGNEELTKQIQKDIDKFDKLGDTILKNAKRSNEIVTEIEEVNNTIQELNDSIEDIRIDAYKASQEAIDNLKELQEEIAETNSLFRDFNEDSFMNSFSIDDTPYEKLIESVDKLGNTYSVTKEKANDFYQDLIDQKKKEAASTKDEDERKAILSAINFFEERRRNLSDDELQNGLLGISMEDLNRLQGWIDGTNKESNPFGTNISALYEAYDDARKRTLELFKDYRETIQDMRDAIVDIYDEQEDAIDRNIDNYNRLLDNLERIGDTYQLYYGEDSYEQILNLMQQQGNTMQSQLDQLTAAYKHWYKEYKKALEIGDETLIEEIENKMNDAEEAMLDKAEELAEHWVEMFEKAVEANTQSIYDRLFNNKDIDELTSNWELQKDYMQRYKDDIEKTYELDKLRSKYIDLLNDAQGASLQTQNKIRQQMQEQLKQLQDQATVSEYDVKLANAKLEILQKQIALEDAQRNKNQMQLRRDTQGNYRYVYRANQDNVKAAQDELLNSEYDAYELTKNETISNNDRALTLVQDFLAKRADIFNKYKDDDEARTKALEELSANYSQLLGTLEEDFRDTTNGMYDILTYMVQNATGDTSTSAMEMLNNLFDEEGKFKENTEVLWADLANVVTEMLENFEDTVEDANEEMISQSEILKTKMTGTNGVLTKIGSSANEMETSLNNATTATNNLAIATSNLFESFSSDSVKFQEMLDKLTDYEEQLRKTQDTTSSLSVQLKNAQATIKTQTAKAEAYHTDLTNLQSGKYTFDKKGNVVSKASLEAQKKQSEATKKSSGSSNWSPYSDAYQIWMNGKWGGGGYWYGPYIAAGHTKAQADQVLRLFNSGYGYKWMDTGGYTGTWNSNEGMSDAKNGKLAVLHQKELILNADDTKNILAAVSIIRELSNSMRESLNPNNLKGTMNVFSTYNPLTEQRVEIQATFPNATDADDIREALIGLSDQAYQYAHRNI